jgi:hypothetical protein
MTLHLAVSGREPSPVFVSGQNFLAAFDVLPWCAAHWVFPDQNDCGIAAQVVFLPLDFQLHFGRGRTAHFFQVLDRHFALCDDPLK